jgi:group I intron endonuclease
MEPKPYTGVVYTATCLLNGKVYVGKSIHGLAVRRNDHEKTARRGKRTKFASALRKYGPTNFSWTELYLSDSNAALLSVEVALIAQLKQAGVQLYNLTDGGEGVIGYTFTEEARKKMSAAAMGRKPSAEAIAKTVAAITGVKKSPDHVRKVAEANRGRKNSPEAIERMKVANQARADRDKKAGIVRKMSENNKRVLREHNLGKKHSPETRLKQSLVKKITESLPYIVVPGKYRRIHSSTLPPFQDQTKGPLGEAAAACPVDPYALSQGQERKPENTTEDSGAQCAAATHYRKAEI